MKVKRGRLECMIWVESFAGFENPISKVQQFAHDGSDDDHLGFALGLQAVGQGLEAGRTQGRHVEGGA